MKSTDQSSRNSWLYDKCNTLLHFISIKFFKMNIKFCFKEIVKTYKSKRVFLCVFFVFLCVFYQEEIKWILFLVTTGGRQWTRFLKEETFKNRIWGIERKPWPLDMATFFWGVDCTKGVTKKRKLLKSTSFVSGFNHHGQVTNFQIQKTSSISPASHSPQRHSSYRGRSFYTPAFHHWRTESDP